MSYLAFKHLHVTLAVVSIVFFVIRAWWSVSESTLLKAKFVRIAPHVIDTLLLLFGVLLAFMLGALPGWLIAKIIGLIVYIAVGTIAIKRGKTPATRAIAAVVAVIVFLYIVGVAITKHPLSWLF